MLASAHVIFQKVHGTPTHAWNPGTLQGFEPSSTNTRYTRRQLYLRIHQIQKSLREGSHSFYVYLQHEYIYKQGAVAESRQAEEGSIPNWSLDCDTPSTLTEGREATHQEAREGTGESAQGPLQRVQPGSAYVCRRHTEAKITTLACPCMKPLHKAYAWKACVGVHLPMYVECMTKLRNRDTRDLGGPSHIRVGHPHVYTCASVGPKHTRV